MIRVACMALRHRIKAGRPNKAGNAFVGGGQDVASDVLKAVIDYVGDGNVSTVTVDGVPSWRISVWRVKEGDDGEGGSHD